jgi:hypothetical protein
MYEAAAGTDPALSLLARTRTVANKVLAGAPALSHVHRAVYGSNMNAEPAPVPSNEDQPSTSGGPASGKRPGLFDRIFSRHIMNAAILMVLPMIFAATLNGNGNLLYDPDIWWHLANARILAEAHHFVRADPFTFTVLGQRWINWEWLPELIYWFGYRAFALRGIYLVAWLSICANVLFVYWRAWLASRHRGAAFWAACVAFVLMSVSAGPRCINIAYLAFSAEMAILESARRGHKRILWLLPPLFCLWVNLHGIWIIGLAVFCLYILCGALRAQFGIVVQEPLSTSDRNRQFAVLAASIAVLIANPDGWRLLVNPLDMMFNQKLNIGVVMEWQPLHLDTPLGISAVVAIGIIVLANCIRRREWTVFDLALVFFAFFAAFDHMRFTFLAAVLLTPMLAQDIERSFLAEPDTGKTIPAMNALIAACAVGFMVYMFPTESALEKKLAEAFPLHIIASIQPSWRTFNADHVGGRMDFESKPAYIDSRFEIFEHRGILAEYLNITSLHDSLELLEKERIDHILITQSAPLAYLLDRTPGWRIQSRESAGDDVYLLYARSADLPAR